MATYSPDLILHFRRLIGDITEPFTYSDEMLSEYLDEYDGDVARAAAAIWREKAVSYTEMVDIREGSSSRSMSQLFGHAQAMANWLDPPAGTDTAKRAGSTPIARR